MWLTRGTLLLLLSFMLSGCGALLVGGGVSTAVADRRSTFDLIDDVWVTNKLSAAYIESEKVKWGNINVRVFRGKVLLTGTAASEEEIQEAIRIAKLTRGVRSVQSELKVQYESAQELAEDAWISTQVKLLLLGDEQVRGLDLHVDTTKKIVYLTGLASSIHERDRAARIASSVQGVAEVVSYIEVDPDSYKPSPLTDEELKKSDDGSPQW
uniref:Putative periplasmic protein n=1 Tax=Magnetococcus massalia (strain MO-1) TaxID=451514 RepID=A0A1S7LM74_MAGMO|nr:Putative periplasmic protein [Candidatus Magnetococcus massalia]